MGTIALKGAAEAETQLKGLEGWAKKNEKALKVLGTAATGFGVAITGALALSVKAAQDEAVNIQKLDQALKNVGVSYDTVKDSLESVITATQRKTGIADSEQRDILGRLILVTNDYNKALKLLPLSLDLAAAGQMDARSAATYLGKAFLDLQNGAQSVSVRLGQATVQFKNLEEMERRVGGAAAAAANPFIILKAEVSDLAEAVGAKLLPIVSSLIGRITTIVGGIGDWIKANPEAAKLTILLAGAFGLLMSAVGPLALILPKLPVMLAAVRVALNLLLGPVGWVTLAITALAGVAIIVANNWESIVDPVGASIRRMTETVREELDKQKALALAKLTSDRNDAQKAYDDKVKAIHDLYGLLKDEAKTRQQYAKDSSDAAKKALQDELNAARRVHDEKITMLEREYDAKIRTLNAESDAAVKALQNQIDAIDKQTDIEGRALKQRQDQDRVAELTKAYRTASTGEESVRALKELNDFKAQIARDALLQQRDDEKDSLRRQIEQIRTTAKDQEQLLQDELKAKKLQQDDMLLATQTRVDSETEALDTALTAELARLDAQGKAKIAMEEANLKATQDRLTNEEKALNESYARQIADAEDFARRRAAALAGSTSTGAGGSTTEQPMTPSIVSWPSPEEWQHGGMITEPSLITRLSDRKPIAIAGEAGPEPVGFGGITITGNNFYVRKESDIDKIAEALIGKIRLQTGVRI